MYLLLLTLVAAALAHPQVPKQQGPAIDPATLRKVFGEPSGKLENSPTTAAATTVATDDVQNDDCKCVPYYMCEGNEIDVHVLNASISGMLDERFGANICREFVEKCCKIVIPKDQVPTLPPPVYRGCGYRQPKGIDVTVVGGEGNEAQFGEFPWVVAILNAETHEYGGVGVLIHPQVVMTGAHVVDQMKKILIRAGEWDTQTTQERLQSQEVLVDKTAVAKDCNLRNLFNDMVLLHLQTPVTLDRHINVACLPEQNENFESAKSCFANGWGKESFGQEGKYAVLLKKIELDMVRADSCQQALRSTRLGRHFRLHESFVCAGGDEGKDACQGDGGAPLVCPIGGDRYKLSGLVAWGIDCGKKGIPGVYVNVSKFMNWVDSTMKSWGLPTDGYRI